MAGQEAVKARDPRVVLFLQELLGQPRHHGLGRDLVHADLVPQVPPQRRRGPLADRRVREPDRPPRPAQHAELAGIEQAEHLRAAGQQQVDGHAVAAARHRDQRLGGQRVTHRVEQRPEHGAGREARLLQRQRLQRVGREQPLVPQFRQHVGQQRGGLAHQRLVRRVVAGDVVPGRRGPVGPLDQEAEEGLLLGREERGQRRGSHRCDPLAHQQERDLDPLPRVARDRTLPGEPLLPPPVPGHRHAPGRPRPLRQLMLGDRAVQHRVRRARPAGPQPLDVPQEQQDPGLERAQRRRDFPRRDLGGHRVMVEREHEQRLGQRLGRRIHRVGPDEVLDPECSPPL